MLAHHFNMRGKLPISITSESFLVAQLRKMLGPMRQSIPVMTMEQTLLSQDRFNVFVIDEVDECLLGRGSAIDL